MNTLELCWCATFLRGAFSVLLLLGAERLLRGRLGPEWRRGLWLLCLVLLKKGILRLQSPTKKVLLGIAIVLFVLYLICLCGYLLGSWPMSFALQFLTQNAYLFLIPGALFALGSC